MLRLSAALAACCAISGCEIVPDIATELPDQNRYVRVTTGGASGEGVSAGGRGGLCVVTEINQADALSCIKAAAPDGSCTYVSAGCAATGQIP